MFKPTFGQTNTTSGFGAFTGAANANPFGQASVFGKTTNTGFAPPAFGATGSTGLFSNTLSSSGGLFGSSTSAPTFGQAQATQPFGFGTTPQPTTNLFGSQPNTGTGLFGSGTTSAFGANKPAFGSTFGTGTSTGLFGAQQPAQTATPLFGQSTPSTGTGLFGASSGTFGASNQQTGTVIKFNPITGTDSLMKNGVTQTISTRHFCITCMKEYESKSLEELRLEDYIANRKGPQQSNLFGAPTQQPSLFGNTSGTTNLFGAPQTTENKNLFGQTSTSLGGFGTSSSNVFGSTPTASNSLFGAKPAFGATTTTTPAFSFGSTSTNNLFGNTQNKPFGTTPQTQLFGQPAAQPSTGFGTNTTFPTFGSQQNQSIGLFGNKPATNFNLGTTTTSGFSFGLNTATNANVFGAKPATSGFGTTPTPGFGTGLGTGTTFGTSTATSASVFKPPTTNFSFGNMQNTGTFGTNTLGTTGSLFGNTAQKPGGLFGSTPGTNLFGSSFGNTTNTFGTGSLGLGNTSVGSSSLFGNTSLMPSQPASSSTHPAILALASVPFADSPLFKNLLPASGKTDSLLKPSNAVTQKAMMACKDLKVSPKNSVKIKLKLLETPLTKKSLFEGLEESDVVSPSFSTMPSVKKLSLKPKNLNSSAVSDSWVENVSNKENQAEKGLGRRVSFTIPNDTNNTEKDSFYIRRNPLFKPQRQNALVDLEQTSLALNKDTIVDAETSQTDGNKSASGTPLNCTLLDETTKDSSKHSNSSLDETRGYLNDTSRYDEEWQPHPTRITLRRLDYYTLPPLDDLISLVGDDGSCIVDNFCIGRYGYGNLYFDETMDVAGLNIDEIVHFRHKEVNVYPDDDKKPSVGKELNRKCQVTLEQVWPVDKTTREPIKDPERLMKLKYEDKLRRSTAKMGATFVEYRPTTGSWVFKVDHFSKYGLTDSDDEEPVDENKMPPGHAGPKAKMSPIPPPATAVTTVQQQFTSRFPFQSPTLGVGKTSSSNILSPILPPTHQAFTMGEPHGSFIGLAGGDQMQEKDNYPGSELGLDIDEEMDEEDAADGFDLLRSFEAAGEHLGPSVHLARRTGIDSHRVQLMKASLFEEEKDDINDIEKYDGVQLMDYTTLGDIQDDHLDALKLSRGLHAFRSRFKSQPIFSKPITHFDPRMDIAPPELPLAPQFIQGLPVLRPRPKTVNIVHSGTVLPYYKSSLSKHSTRCASDSGIYMGRSFRNGWGPCSSFMNLTTLWNVDNQRDNILNLGGRSYADSSPTAVQRLFMYNESDQLFKDSIEGHLLIQLEHSNKGEEDGCPIISPQSGVDVLHAHCLLVSGEEPQSEFDVYCRQVWELCVALWGNLPTLSAEDDPLSHKTIMMRKEAITEWLKKCTAKTIRKEVEEYTNNSKKVNQYISAVLSLLSGKEIEEACTRLQKEGDHFAALLLTSGPTSKVFFQNQLSEWQNVGADAYIETERLKLFCLSSGLPLLSSAQGIVNICEDLDWRRAFAVHFWYLLSPVCTIADVIKKYEAAFDGPEAYSCRPNPPYGEATTTSGRHIYDLCYHLIKLYCFKSHPLEQLLNPAAYSSDPLDYRLSWLLEQVLCSLGYVHVSKLSSAITCTSFASQLEAHGLWQWSIFVYLHIHDSFRRKQAVLDMIGRHVTLTEDRELTPEEDFIVSELGVPADWVFRAKATLALSQFRYHDATFYLIQAREWNEAHQIIIRHISADAVINENYDYLRDLLESLVPNSTSISEWFYLGQLLWDYLEVSRVVQQALVEQNTYELEGRQMQISSICARITRWPCPTVKDRLCQAEIAKRMAHIYRNVMRLHGRMTQSDVAEVVSKLPLPEDYLMEELRHIKEMFPST